MSRVVEISPDGLGAVRADVAATRDAIRDDLGPLRWRMSNLNVPTGALHDVLGVADRLESDVLPTLDWHVARARDLDSMRYRGSMGSSLPVIDGEVFGPPPAPFVQTPFGDGSTALTWPAAPVEEQKADRQDTERSRGIGGWFGDRWDDVTEAVDDGTDWLAEQATDAWDQVTEAGAELGDWWETTTADLGGWIDENLDGVREFIGKHVAVFRFLADVCRIVGWVVVVIGAVLTVVLAVVGGLVGFGAGTLLGGVGGVPAGGAGALAGASAGLKILGVGFALVSVGDFLDVAADWGEGKIDGQDLVKKGSLEIGLALTSLIGFGVVGKIAQKTYRHLPDSWVKRIDDWFTPRTGTHLPASDNDMRAPLHDSAGLGPGWTRGADIEPDALYGQTRPDFAPLNKWNEVPSTINPDIQRLGGDLSDPWGINPDTGLPFTQSEWLERFTGRLGRRPLATQPRRRARHTGRLHRRRALPRDLRRQVRPHRRHRWRLPGRPTGRLVRRESAAPGAPEPRPQQLHVRS